MKSFKYISGTVCMFLVFLTSCTDFVEPNIPYTNFDTGTYLRTVQRVSASFSFFDLGNSTFNVVVEVVSPDPQPVEFVEVRVRKQRVVPGVGLVFVPTGTATQVNDVLIKTIPGSSFVPDPNPDPARRSRFLRTTIVVTANEAMQILGITPAQVNAGDTFEFRLSLRDTRGRTFNNINASPDIRFGAFYDSPFLYNVRVVCPSDLGGIYSYESSEMSSPFGSCPGTITGNVTLTPVAGTTSYTVSDASFGLFACLNDTWGDGNVRLNDACGLLSFLGTDKYGDTYTFNFISNNGAELRFNWRNASNETGNVVLFANPGKPWPPTLR